MTDTLDAGNTGGADDLAQKQEMVEKLFRHTNSFLEENKHDPLLVVEALAAILVRYGALLGPVEQIDQRLEVLHGLIGQEIAQIKEIAKSGITTDPQGRRTTTSQRDVGPKAEPRAARNPAKEP